MLFETNKQINIFFSFNCRHLKKSEDDINSIFFWSALYFHFFGIDNKLYAGTEQIILICQTYLFMHLLKSNHIALTNLKRAYIKEDAYIN